MRTQHIKGLDRLKENLKRLPDEIQRKVVRTANRKGAKIMLDQAKSLAPIDTGALRDGLTTRVGRSIKKLIFTNLVGVTDNKFMPRSPRDLPPTIYSKMVEYGHKKPDGSKVPPDPFMRNTFDLSGDMAISAVVDALDAGIQERATHINGGAR